MINAYIKKKRSQINNLTLYPTELEGEKQTKPYVRKTKKKKRKEQRSQWKQRLNNTIEKVKERRVGFLKR